MNEDAAIGRLRRRQPDARKGRSLPEDYGASDWLAALRHGVHQDGTPLLFMPSHETTLLSQQDMSALIAYCRQIPDVDHVLPANDLGPIALVMSYLDKMPLLSVEKINHKRPMVAKVDSTEGHSTRNTSLCHVRVAIGIISGAVSHWRQAFRQCPTSPQPDM